MYTHLQGCPQPAWKSVFLLAMCPHPFVAVHRRWGHVDGLPAVLENAAVRLVPSRAVSLPLLIGAQCPPPSHAVSVRLPIRLSPLLSAGHLADAREAEARAHIPYKCGDERHLAGGAECSLVRLQVRICRQCANPRGSSVGASDGARGASCSAAAARPSRYRVVGKQSACVYHSCASALLAERHGTRCRHRSPPKPDSDPGAAAILVSPCSAPREL